MKILALMPYVPVPPTFGGAMRIYYLMKNLASTHDVTLLTFGTSDDEILLQQEFGSILEDIHVLPAPWSREFKRSAQGFVLFTNRSYSNLNCYSKRMQQRIDSLLSGGEFDTVHTEFSFMGQYRIKPGVHTVLDAHNVEFDNFRRMWMKARNPLKKSFYRREFRNVYREEKRALDKQDLLLVTSDADRKVIHENLTHTPARIIPNGVDMTFFTPSDQKPEPYSMVFTGMMGYTPNNDGMHWFLDEIFPRIQNEIPEAKIYIVGNRPPAALKRRENDHVVVTGFVDDVRPYVWRSSVFVVPLRMGSGTRLKVVEALAMNKPVVSSTIGCEGIRVEDNKSILIQDDPALFADSVVHLLRDRALRERLTFHGYDLVKNSYNWPVIGQKLLEIYQGDRHRYNGSVMSIYK